MSGEKEQQPKESGKPPRSEGKSQTRDQAAPDKPTATDKAAPDKAASDKQEKSAAKPKKAEPKARDAGKAQGTKAKAAAKAKPRKPRKKKEPEKPPEPSYNQPILDAYVKKINDTFGEGTVVAADINRPNGHLPTIRIKRERWAEVAALLKGDPDLAFNYLRDLTAYDDQDFINVAVHLFSFSRRQSLAVHIRTERDPARVPSVTSVWQAANWNEREVYDLFGVDFTGHPNMTRIMMPDDWVGHPLRKDYKPLDEEV